MYRTLELGIASKKSIMDQMFIVNESPCLDSKIHCNSWVKG